MRGERSDVLTYILTLLTFYATKRRQLTLSYDETHDGSLRNGYFDFVNLRARFVFGDEEQACTQACGQRISTAFNETRR